jgi:hypothetical protein
MRTYKIHRGVIQLLFFVYISDEMKHSSIFPDILKYNKYRWSSMNKSIISALVASLSLLSATILSKIVEQQTADAAPKEGPFGTKKECRDFVVDTLGRTNQNASRTCNSFEYN